MSQARSAAWMTADREREFSAEVARQGPRLASFIRRRVPDAAEAEDILQDVFFELAGAYRDSSPLEDVGAWLYRVARNRIIDFFRKRRPEALEEGVEDLLPSADAGPEAAYARAVLIEELEAGLEELPAE